jgi:hypothetical protein
MSHTKPALGLALASILLAGCGKGSNSTRLSADQLPLVHGAQILAQARQCDHGANAFCSLELVVADGRFHSSGDLVTLEGVLLRRAGWIRVPGDAGNEGGANSPGDKLHLSYGTALADLEGTGVNWFKRSKPLALILSREEFTHVPAMALTLESGPA